VQLWQAACIGLKLGLILGLGFRFSDRVSISFRVSSGELNEFLKSPIMPCARPCAIHGCHVAAVCTVVW